MNRIEDWRRAHNMVAIGNLGEQVAMRVLIRWGYHVLATQEDLRGGVENILEMPTRMNPEDFVCVTPEGRMVTANSKATVSPRASGTDRDGNLVRPRIAKGQNAVEYTTVRGGLPSPIDSEVDGQVLKVALQTVWRVSIAAIFDQAHRIGKATPAYRAKFYRMLNSRGAGGE